MHSVGRVGMMNLRVSTFLFQPQILGALLKSFSLKSWMRKLKRKKTLIIIMPEFIVSRCVSEMLGVQEKRVPRR